MAKKTISRSRSPEQYLRHKKRQARVYRERRALAIEILGGRCAYCGYSKPDGLDIDHIDPETKSVHANQLHNVSMERFIVEVSKCQLLCHSPCHSIKTVGERWEAWEKENGNAGESPEADDNVFVDENIF